MLLFCNFEFMSLHRLVNTVTWLFQCVSLGLWFDKGVAIGGLFPLMFKSLIFPPDIDTPGLLERYGN